VRAAHFVGLYLELRPDDTDAHEQLAGFLRKRAEALRK
jgi:hypothetical protein